MDHAEYLEKVKKWGVNHGELMAPFAVIAKMLAENNPEELIVVKTMFPLGLRLVINSLNDFYKDLQLEAIKVLGAPFQIHNQHHPECGKIEDICGHQDHFIQGDSNV